MQRITEVLPKSGLVFSQKGSLTEALARPKIMPLKSITLEKIEQMENEAAVRCCLLNLLSLLLFKG